MDITLIPNELLEQLDSSEVSKETKEEGVTKLLSSMIENKETFHESNNSGNVQKNEAIILATMARLMEFNVAGSFKQFYNDNMLHLFLKIKIIEWINFKNVNDETLDLVLEYFMTHGQMTDVVAHSILLEAVKSQRFGTIKICMSKSSILKKEATWFAWIVRTIAEADKERLLYKTNNQQQKAQKCQVELDKWFDLLKMFKNEYEPNLDWKEDIIDRQIWFLSMIMPEPTLFELLLNGFKDQIDQMTLNHAILFLFANREFDVKQHLLCLFQNVHNTFVQSHGFQFSNILCHLATDTNPDHVKIKFELLEKYFPHQLDTADPNWVDGNGDTIFSIISSRANLSIIEMFLNRFGYKIDPNIQNQHGDTGFFQFCRRVKSPEDVRKGMSLIKQYIKEPIDQSAQNNQGDSAAFVLLQRVYAQQASASAQMAALPHIPPFQAIQHTFDLMPDSKIRRQFDALNMLSAPMGIDVGLNVAADIFSNLDPLPVCNAILSAIKHEVDVNAVNRSGDTVLMVAIAMHCSIEIIQFILDSLGENMDPNVQRKDTCETVAILSAKENGYALSHIMQYFGQRIDPNLCDKNGSTLLMHAVLNCTPDDVKAILNLPKIDVSLQNKYEQDVRDLIKEKPDIDSRIKKMVENAFQRQLAIPDQTSEKIKHHIGGLRSVVQSCKIPAQSKDILEGQLNAFVEEIDHVMHGRYRDNIGISSIHRRKLQGTRVLLLEELTPEDGLLDHLYQDQIITDDEREELSSFTTRRKKAEKLLSILPYRGDKAFECFTKALKATKKEYIVEALEKYDPDTKENQDQIEDGSLVPIEGGMCRFEQGYGRVDGFRMPPQLPANDSFTLEVKLHREVNK